MQASERADALISWIKDYNASRLNSVLIDERRCIPPYVILDFGRVGLLGLQADPEFGGLGLCNVESRRVVAQLAASDLTLATMAGIHNLLGIRPIEAFGSDATKERYLPQLASGRILGGLAITEHGAGSNPRAMASYATREADCWCVSGRKIWIGNGSWAGVLNVFARVRKDDQLTGVVLGCVVQSDRPGLVMGPEALTMGMRGVVQNEVVLTNVRVPLEDVLGTAGEGLRVADDSFARARLGISFMAVGAIQRCIQIAWRYATSRRISSGRLADNAYTVRRLSEMHYAVTALDALNLTAAQAIDRGEGPPATMIMACKILGPELLGESVDRTLQLLGGRGYIETNAVPQLYRDARLLRIFEGPSETMAAHLGWLALNAGRQLTRALAEELCQPAIAHRLHEVAERIADESEPSEPSEDATIALGMATAWAFLAAGVAYQQQLHGQGLELATRWAALRFERVLGSMLRDRADPFPELPELAAVLDSYEEQLGPLQQLLPGAQYGLDSLLEPPST